MSAHISQREALRLKKRVAQLETNERRRNEYWSREWFGGTEISAINLGADHASMVAVRTARKLGHYVVAVHDADALRFYAVRRGEVT